MKRVFLILSLIFLLSGPVKSEERCGPLSREEAPEVARALALMLVAGRSVVAEHQNLINDPSKGEKGFSPRYVVDLMKKKFAQLYGKRVEELPPAEKRLVEEMLRAAYMVVFLNQDRINQKGVGYKGFIPAIFGREVGHLLAFRCGLRLKQTSLRYRNPYNRPDEFEEEGLRQMAGHENGTAVQGIGRFVDGYYRYLHPIYVKKACLKCHGEPAGALDITGHPKEGYREGEVRGAISVVLPINK